MFEDDEGFIGDTDFVKEVVFEPPKKEDMDIKVVPLSPRVKVALIGANGATGRAITKHA